VPTKTREIHLAKRPQGEPTVDDFRLVETTLPDPGPGEVLVKNLWMSVDPYMRGRMNDVPSYLPPWRLDEAATGGAVGKVLASESAEVPVGSLVLHDAGWRQHAVLPAQQVRVVPKVEGLSPSVYLGVLGMPGLTAYAGLFRIAEYVDGDVVFVSGAAGAVGSLVGQFAKLRGSKRVIGSAGSADKVRYLLNELGFDAAFNYRDGPMPEQLKAAAPLGINVYFDNVGGDHLEAAIGSLRRNGRVALCGAISSYNATKAPSGPRNLALAIGKRLTLRGFIVLDHYDLLAEFTEVVGAWLRDGKVVFHETVVDGLDNAPVAFLGLLRGKNIGKMLVRLA
jgi:NADPH-dependent curcumin reductase CurA